MITTEVGIRRASAADRPALAGLMAGDWETWLAAPGYYTYLAETDVPFACVTSGPPSIDPGNGVPTGEIHSWAVDPEYQQLGYGRRLLVHGLTVLKRRQFEQALIWLPVAAARAQSVTRFAGFKAITGERLTNLNDGTRIEHCYLMDLSAYF